MEFGIEKRAVLVKKKGKLVTTEGIAIPGERLIRAMNEGDVDAYKYLGVLEGEEIKHTEMKRRIEDWWENGPSNQLYGSSSSGICGRNSGVDERRAN